jgi:L-asparaginase II
MKIKNLSCAPLIYTTRDGMVDNIHRGSVVVADDAGRIHAKLGDPNKVAFLRSSAKPLQAIALVERGGVERFGLTDAEVALICASHRGLDLHVATVGGILAKIGCAQSDLHAGSGIRDNCSGKHSGMLALCRLLGLPVKDYRSPRHKIQAVIKQTVADMCGLKPNQIGVAVDGCGAPIFAMPIRNMAIGFARLATPDGLPPERRRACETISHAMMNHPEMVGGVDFRGICPGKVVAKSGASGVYCAGLVGRRLGFAMKMDDGTNVSEALIFFTMMRRLKKITDTGYRKYLATAPLTVKNRCGETIGRIMIAF